MDELELRRSRDLPYWVGLILCVKCFNRWTATFPDGTPLTKMECPKCKAQESFATLLPPSYGETDEKL